MTETLIDFLKVRDCELTRATCLDDIIKLGLRVEYDFVKWGRYDTFYEDEVRRGSDMSLHLNGYLRGNSLCIEDGTLEFMGKINKKVRAANREEVFEFCRTLTGRVKLKLPKDYYRFACRFYYEMTEQCSETGPRLLKLTQDVEPLLAVNNGILSIEELRRILGKERWKEINKLFFTMGFFNVNELTVSDVKDFHSSFDELDANRDRLHNDLVEYGGEHFGKDRLDVFFDLFLVKPLRRGSLGFRIPQLKPDCAILNLGYYDIPVGGGDFRKEYGEPLDRFDKGGYSLMARLKIERRSLYFEGNYKSRINEGKRTEQDDDEILRKVRERYPGHVRYNKHFPDSAAHGHISFQKILEINIGRIKRLENNPEGKIEEITEYINSLIPA